jgi:hypothetical protein
VSNCLAKPKPECQVNRSHSLTRLLKPYFARKLSTLASGAGTGNVAVVTPGWYRIDRKALILAAIFLVVALIFPIFVIYEDSAATTRYVIEVGQNQNDQTALTSALNQLQSTQNNLIVVLIIAETVLIILFAISMWTALKPPHEKHEEHKDIKHDVPGFD